MLKVFCRAFDGMMDARRFKIFGYLAVCLVGFGLATSGAEVGEGEEVVEHEGNAALEAWLEEQTRRFSGRLEREVKTKEDWLENREEYRRQLAEMLGLDPMPEKTDLRSVKTGEFEQDGVVVEKWHYQPMPGFYVTANFYRPKELKEGEKLPAVLYVCGHANKMKAGVSFGNKTGYEHHGMWYAKHGFVCLMIDTVQLGEIRGVHHGTHNLGRWWWLSRGYTPAGVEAWSGIRGLDFLEARAEVDGARMGVTGRSGGGAYSWWVAALDERVKCAVPTAGITTLKNHVVDGKVAGHCDCMFMVNTYRWDYDKVAALVAPRALLIANTDRDPIFPLDGVVEIYENVRRIYGLLGEEGKVGLHIAEGGHADVQPLYVGEFHWMMRHLQGEGVMSSFDGAAKKTIEMERLRVFGEELPKDEINTKIDEVFVKAAGAMKVPADEVEWAKWRDGWMKVLKEKVLADAARDRGTNGRSGLEVKQWVRDGVKLWEFGEVDWKSLVDLDTVPELVRGQRLYMVTPEKVGLEELELVVMNVLDEQSWKQFADTFGSRFKEVKWGVEVTPDEKAFEAEKKMHKSQKWGMAYVAPRGVGPTAWLGTEKENTHRLRSFYLLGTTLEAEQVRDIRDAIGALRRVDGLQKTKWWVQAARKQAVNAVYASLFVDGIERLDLHETPVSHEHGPAYLAVMKHLDVPQALAMAAERTRVVVYADEQKPWETVKQTVEKMGWSGAKGKVKRGLQLREVPKVEGAE